MRLLGGHPAAVFVTDGLRILRLDGSNRRPHDAAADGSSPRASGAQLIGGQLAQARQIGALVVEQGEQEGWFRESKLVPAVQTGYGAIGSVVALSGLISHVAH